MIAASEEMHEEKTNFSSLIEHLNEVLTPRGIELKRVKWDPETDGTLKDYLAELHNCEMCLTLYWRELAGNSEGELNTAYQELKQGNNPHKLYVFFKEPEENISESLKDFKANFVTNYGHFFCKFENVDTMNLHFILQFEAYQNSILSELVKVSDGKVFVDNKEMVNLESVPFAALNNEYQRLQKELLNLDEQIAEIRKRHKEDPDNEALEDEFFEIKMKRKKLADEFEKYQQHLYDIALNFAKLSGKLYSERIRKAREQFEMGNPIEADQILNMEEMKREKENEMKQYAENIHNLELKIEEFRMKADTVMANTILSIPDRFAVACEAYEEAINTARKIHYKEERLAGILFVYANLLADYNKKYEAVKYYQEALDIRQRLATANPDTYLPDLARTLNNLANLQVDLSRENLGRYGEAEKNHKEALEIQRRLADSNPDAYLPDLAMTLNNIANLQVDLGRYGEAEKNHKEALEIRRRLADSNPDAYLPDLAVTLNNIAVLQVRLGRYGEAEKNHKEALEIRRRLADSNPDAYLPNLAMTLNNIANLQRKLGQYEGAEKNYKEALEIQRRLADYIPDTYLIDLAMTLTNLANFQKKLSRYDEAEKYQKEASKILQCLVYTRRGRYLFNLLDPLYKLGILIDKAKKKLLKAKATIRNLNCKLLACIAKK